jgi:hypothetical protein
MSEWLLPAVLGSGLLLSVIGSILYYKFVFEPREQKKWDEENKKAQEKERHDYLCFKAVTVFGVDIEGSFGNAVFDEIVRNVNLLAFKAAEACVKQDIQTREGGSKYSDWASEAVHSKREWSEARNLAILIRPQLTDRMPHFSEFEPLKSYNAEHQQMKAKRAAQR